MQGVADGGDLDPASDEYAESIERGETTDLTFESTVESNLAQYNDEIQRYLAGYLHRGATATSPVKCNSRIRLTPSGPGKAGCPTSSLQE